MFSEKNHSLHGSAELL